MKPIILNENDSSQEFLYIQLYESIKKDILDGTIKPGEKFPSLRSLAAALKVSVTTVELAYSQLVTEGYLISKPKSGYYAQQINSRNGENNILQKQSAESELNKEETSRSSGLEYSHNPLDSDDRNSLYDTKTFDFVKWKKCAAKVFNEHAGDLMFESDPQGEKLLRHEISRYLYMSRGVIAPETQIVIGAGTQNITSYLGRILREMKISFVNLELPGYLPVQDMLKDAGFQLNHIPVNDQGIEIEQLPENISSAVYVSPSNQFPTGAVMPIARRYELLEWAGRNGSIIIEDDYDSELRYFGKPLSPLKSLDHNNSVVYLGSFSSTLFPAIKISYMVLTPDMMEVFETMKNRYMQTCSKAEQLTLAYFMKEGYYYTGIRKKRASYTKKLQEVLTFLQYNAKDMIVPLGTESGISMIIEVRSDKTQEQLISDAASLGLTMIPVSRISDQDTTALSFYYSKIPQRDIIPVLHSLVDLWKS